jgi:high-affinity nickel-transport protein
LRISGLGAALLRNRAPVLLGAVHGLAGSAALALLVLATIPSRWFGALYLLAFGAGALLGMAAFSAILSLPLARAGRSDTWLTRVRFAAGAANATLGAFLIYRAFWPAPF